MCSSPCTNINNMSISTSAKLPSKAMKTSNHHRTKELKIVYVKICSLRNNIHKINNFLATDDIHILTISETNLGNTFDDTVVAIQGYNI